jgi:hypothetical protein
MNKHDLHDPDGSIKRFCTKCKTIKPLESGFSHKHKLENGTFEYHSICKQCRVHYARKRNFAKGHKPTLSMRKDTTSKLFLLNQKIAQLERQRDVLLNNKDGAIKDAIIAVGEAWEGKHDDRFDRLMATRDAAQDVINACNCGLMDKYNKNTFPPP